MAAATDANKANQANQANQATVRLNADIAPDVAQALQTLAQLQNVSLSEALSRAIGTELSLLQQRRQGAKVLVESKGKLSQLTFAL